MSRLENGVTRYSSLEIVNNFSLWQTYVDPSGVDSEDTFNRQTIAERLQIINDCFGEIDDGAKKYLAASMLGSIKTARKAAASAANGKAFGGRPVDPTSKRQEIIRQEKINELKSAIEAETDDDARRALYKQLFNTVANAYYLANTARTFEELDKSGYLSYEQNSWADGLYGDEWENPDYCEGCAEEVASQSLQEEADQEEAE